jgi:hypothetical protein
MTMDHSGGAEKQGNSADSVVVYRPYFTLVAHKRILQEICEGERGAMAAVEPAGGG